MQYKTTHRMITIFYLLFASNKGASKPEDIILAMRAEVVTLNPQIIYPYHLNTKKQILALNF